MMRTDALIVHIEKMSTVAHDLLHNVDPATRKATILLIAHTSGLRQKDVKKAIVAMSQLKRKYAP